MGSFFDQFILLSVSLIPSSYYISLFYSFAIEGFLLFLISLLIFRYLFSINLKLHNDNFPISFYSLFIFFFFLIMIYYFLIDPTLFFFSNRWISLESNNFIIKLFLLLQLSILCVLWPCNKILSNIFVTYKLLILILFILLGLCVVINARDFMLLYLGIELASLPIYILVSNKEYMVSIEAGIKYYILGALSSFFFLLGVSFIYGSTGSTLYNVLYIYELYVEYIDNYYLYLVFFFIIIIFLFKIGIYPFNFWVTNFNEGSSLNIAFFLAIIPKLPFIYILVILLFYIFNISFYLKLYVIFILFSLCFITIFTSIIEGLSDNHIGRILGQSSMINMSFIFIIILSLSIIQESFFLFIFMFYLLPTLCLLNLISLRDISLTKRDLTMLHDIFVINNYITLLFYFTIISLSGLPFLAGFVGKWFIFEFLIHYNFLNVVILLVISSIFSNLFYIRIFFYISNRIRFHNLKLQRSNYLKNLLLTILSFLNLYLILLQEPFIGNLLSLYI